MHNNINLTPHHQTPPPPSRYTSSSGIWQSVWVEAVPMEHISDLKFSTHKGPKRSRMLVRVLLTMFMRFVLMPVVIGCCYLFAVLLALMLG